MKSLNASDVAYYDGIRIQIQAAERHSPFFSALAYGPVAIFPEAGSKLRPEPPGPHTVPIILKETHKGGGRRGNVSSIPTSLFPTWQPPPGSGK